MTRAVLSRLGFAADCALGFAADCALGFAGERGDRDGFPGRPGSSRGREESDIYVLMYLGSWWV